MMGRRGGGEASLRMFRKGTIGLVLPVLPWPSGGVAGPAGSAPEGCILRTRSDAIAKGVYLMAKVRAYHLATKALFSPRLGDVSQCTVSFGDCACHDIFLYTGGRKTRGVYGCIGTAFRNIMLKPSLSGPLPTVIENTSHQPMALHRLTGGSTAVLLDTAVRRRTP